MLTTPSARIRPSQSQLAKEKYKKQQKLVPIDILPKDNNEALNLNYEITKEDLRKSERNTVRNSYENNTQDILTDQDCSNNTIELSGRNFPVTGLRDSI